MQTITKVLAISFSLSLLLSAIISCEAEDDNPSGKPKPGYLDQMPEETTIGANTFGCYINGELAAARGRFQEEGVELYTSYVNGFWKKYKNDTCMNLDIVIKDVVYYLNIYDKPFVGMNDCFFRIVFESIPKMSGGINTTINIIKFDTLSHIISGRFNNITIPMQFSESIVHLTDGQFDIKYGQNF